MRLAFSLGGALLLSSVLHADTPAPAEKTKVSSSATAGSTVSPLAERATEAKAQATLEQAAYLQRLAVCSKLREVGMASNDDDLIAQADKLESQATRLYQQKLKFVEAQVTLQAKKIEAATKKADMAKAATEVVGYAPNGRPIRGEAK
jgi:hypothetical protein